MKHIYTSILLFLTTFVHAQNITSAQSDCANAIIFQDSIYGPLEVPKGHGQKLEIKGHNIRNEYFFTKEHNTLWIKLHFTRDTRFEFEIMPVNPRDDYDFSIFKINGPNFCDSIATNKILPVRSNLCRRKPDNGSITGLKEGYTNLYAAAGESPSFSAPLDVKKDEEYYLVLDGPYGFISGFSIELKYNQAPISKKEAIIQETIEKIPKKIKLIVLDQDSLPIVQPEIVIRGTGSMDSTFLDQDSVFNIISERKLSSYYFTITGKGYKQAIFDYLHREDHDTTLIYVLDKLKIGSKLQFNKINFVGNQATILPSSKEDLENLTLFLHKNSNINVEIGGHVNARGKRNKRKFKKLSSARAKAIVEYLSSQNINADRLTYKGYGNAEMIYPNATTEEQSQQNRRVEIIVTKL